MVDSVSDHILTILWMQNFPLRVCLLTFLSFYLLQSNTPKERFGVTDTHSSNLEVSESNELQCISLSPTANQTTISVNVHTMHLSWSPNWNWEKIHSVLCFTKIQVSFDKATPTLSSYGSIKMLSDGYSPNQIHHQYVVDTFWHCSVKLWTLPGVHPSILITAVIPHV